MERGETVYIHYAMGLFSYWPSYLVFFALLNVKYLQFISLKASRSAYC